jgi:Na+:H+ antiporter
LGINVDLFIFVGSVIILLGLAGELVVRRYLIPISLSLIFFGYVVGIVHLSLFGVTYLPISAGPFLKVAPIFATFALIMILFYGGLEIKISSFSKQITRIMIEVNLYVLLGIFSIGFLTMYFLHWDVWSSLLMGSMVGGETTAAVVVPLTKILRMSEETKAFLILESALNSIYSVVFYFAFLRVILGGSPTAGAILSGIGIALVAGVLSGVGFGLLWRVIAIRLEHFQFAYAVAIVVLMFSYLASNPFNGGFISVVVFGLVAVPRNKDSILLLQTDNEGMLSARESSLRSNYLNSFQQEIAFVLEAFFFAFMGLLLTELPSATVLTDLFYGLVFTSLLFGLRFVSSRVSTMQSSMWQEKNLILFTMAQGLTPAVLAVSTYTYLPATAPEYLALTLSVILFTNLVTIGAPIISRWANRQVVHS